MPAPIPHKEIMLREIIFTCKTYHVMISETSFVVEDRLGLKNMILIIYCKLKSQNDIL